MASACVLLLLLLRRLLLLRPLLPCVIFIVVCWRNRGATLIGPFQTEREHYNNNKLIVYYILSQRASGLRCA